MFTSESDSGSLTARILNAPPGRIALLFEPPDSDLWTTDLDQAKSQGNDVTLEAWAPDAINGFRLLEKVAEGGMGIVWRAIQLSTRRTVALKVLKNRTLGPSDRYDRFTREVEISAGLEHPGIARVYESGLLDGRFFFAMEWVDGCDIAAAVTARHVAIRTIVQWMATVSEAIGYAHSRGVVHGDLKPGNILVDNEGRPRVVDFGLAGTFGRDGGESTRAGGGTRGFLAPEIVAADSPLAPLVDVYALGVTLRELLRLPNRKPESVSHELRAIIENACAPAPADRYPDGGALADDLRRWLHRQPVRAVSGSVAYRTRKFVSRHRKLAALALAAVALVTTVTSLAVHRARRAEQNAVAVHAQAQRRAAMQQIRTALASSTSGDTAAAIAEWQRVPSSERDWAWRAAGYVIDQSDWTRQIKRPVAACRFHAQTGQVVAVGAATITVLDADTGAVISARTIDLASGQITISGDGTVVAGLRADGSIATYSLGSDAKIDELRRLMPDGEVWTLSLNHDGSRLATFRYDGTVELWAPQLGRRVSLAVVPIASPRIHLSPSGNGLLLVGDQIVYRNLASNSHFVFAGLDGGNVSAAVFSPDERHIFLGFRDGRVVEGDMDGGTRLIGSVEGGRIVDSLSISQDGCRLAAGDRQGVITVWNLHRRVQTAGLVGHSSFACGLAFDASGQMLFSAGDDGTVRRWLLGPDEFDAVSAQGTMLTAAAADPVAEVFAWGDQQGNVHVHEGSLLRETTFKAYNASVIALAVCQSRNLLLAADLDGKLAAWRITDLIRIGHADLRPNQVRLLLPISLDGNAIALTTKNSGSAFIYDTQDHLFQHWLPDKRLVSMSVDGRYLAAADRPEDGGGLSLWDADGHDCIRAFPGRTSHVIALTIGGDARYLAAAYGDGSIVVHDMANNDEFVLHLEQADGHPLAVACHPTDPILAVAGRSVRLYDLQTRELLFVLPQRQQGPFHWLAFSDSGHRLTAAGLRGVAIWRAK